jgi:hypothetical protein
MAVGCVMRSRRGPGLVSRDRAHQAESKDDTDLVRRGEATLGLHYYTSDRPDLVSLDAGSEAMLVAAAHGHRLVH